MFRNFEHLNFIILKEKILLFCKLQIELIFKLNLLAIIIKNKELKIGLDFLPLSTALLTAIPLHPNFNPTCEISEHIRMFCFCEYPDLPKHPFQFPLDFTFVTSRF